MVDIFKLDALTYAPTKGLDRLSGYIWPERYYDMPEFEIRTPDVPWGRSEMPEGTLLAHRESADIMRVDSHEISITDEGREELVVRGQSILKVLAERESTASPNDGIGYIHWTSAYSKTPLDQTIHLLAPNVMDPPSAYVGSVMPHLPIHNTTITLSRGLGAGGVMEQSPRMVPTLDAVLENLSHIGAAVRIVRPGFAVGSTMTYTTLNWTANGVEANKIDADTGVLNGTARFHIYKGRNRTVDQSTNPRVFFDQSAGHVSNPRYLTNRRDYRNTCLVISPFADVANQVVYAPGTSSSVSGLDRRLMTCAPDDIQESYTPAKRKSLLIKRGQEALSAQNQKLTTFDGQITSIAPFRYRTHYDLGDIVTVKGTYGFAYSLMVSEYTFTMDSSGRRAYPTFSTPS